MDERFFDEQKLQQDDLIKPSVYGFWSEKIFVITDNYEIKRYVFMPKTAGKNRGLSNILNSDKRFIAIKDLEIRTRGGSEKKAEHCSFIRLNLDSTTLIRSCREG